MSMFSNTADTSKVNNRSQSIADKYNAYLRWAENNVKTLAKNKMIND